MIVYDKNTFGSNRDIDTNGYLRVEECNISKCQIRPYLGKEIPNYKEFGLEPDKIYNVYCPKEELEKAAPTFNNLPLTREHIEVDVESVPKEKIVGSLGDHASFEYPYLKNNLIIYDKKDIDLVMSGKKKELSCGYRYTPVRQSGEADGQHYDFVMTDIIGNHVALVKQGRAGRDVMVADSSKGILETIKEKIMAVFDKDLVEDEFKESEHPRAENGQFITAGGSGSEKKDMTESQKERYDVHKKAGEELLERASGVEDLMTRKQARKELEELEKLDKQILTSGVLSDDEIDEYHQAFLRAEDYIVSKNTDNSWGNEDLDDETAEKYKEAKKHLRKAEISKNMGNYKEAEEHEKKADELSGIKSEKKEESSKKPELEEGQIYESEAKKFWEENHNDDPILSEYDSYEEWYKDSKINGYIVEDSAKQEKVGVVMKEFKDGELNSGSGEKVTDPKQAIAIALSEADKVAEDKEIPEKQDEPEKAGDEVALNKGEKKMADEVKKAPAEEKVEEVKEEKVTEDTCEKAEDKEVKPACDEKEDKRKLIDEIGGILKDKLSEEEWRTVIAKAEKLAYNDSEASADDEKCEEPKGEIAGDEEEVKVEEKEEEKAEGKEMAKDEALVMDADAIRAEAKAEVIADFKARETARRAVRKMVGDVDVFAFDSADEIYKFACEKAGMNLTEIVSFKDAFQGLSMVKGGKLAMDASPVSGSNVECFKNIRIAN